MNTCACGIRYRGDAPRCGICELERRIAERAAAASAELVRRQRDAERDEPV